MDPHHTGSDLVHMVEGTQRDRPVSLTTRDVSTANEFLVRVPTGIRRSIAPAARQILDFDITGLIDEYDTNRPCRTADFVWLPLPMRGISRPRLGDTRDPLSRPISFVKRHHAN